MVRCQSMSPGRGRRVRAARSSAPRTAWRVRCSSRASSSRTSSPTTRRAVSRLLAGMTCFSASSVVTSSTSGWTVSSSSGSSSSWRRPEPLDRVALHTRTTLVGKRRRTSPSQRATRGAEAPRPPARPSSSSLSYSAPSAASSSASRPAADRRPVVGSRRPAPAASAGAAPPRGRSSRRLRASHDGGEHRQHPRGSRLVHVAARLDRRPGQRPGEAGRGRADLRRSAAGKRAKARRTSGRVLVKAWSGSAASHASISPSSRASCSSSTPEPPRKPSSQAAAAAASVLGDRRCARRRSASAPSRRPPSRSSRVAWPATSPCVVAAVASRASAACHASPLGRPVEQRDRPVHPVDAGPHVLGGLVVEGRARRHETDRDALRHAGQHAQHALGVGAPHVAVAGDARQRRQRLHERDRVGGDRRPVAERAHGGLGGAGEVGEERLLEQAREGRQRGLRVGSLARRTPAASSTVPPQALAAMTSTASSGRQASRQVSRKVPVVGARRGPARPTPRRAAAAGAAGGCGRGRCRGAGRARAAARRRRAASAGAAAGGRGPRPAGRAASPAARCPGPRRPRAGRAPAAAWPRSRRRTPRGRRPAPRRGPRPASCAGRPGSRPGGWPRWRGRSRRRGPPPAAGGPRAPGSGRRRGPARRRGGRTSRAP